MAVVVALALLASRLDYVPLWDGRIYADCIVTTALGALDASTLRCVDHVSHSYMLYAGAIQMLSPGSYPLILLANTLLYLASCAAFFLIVRGAFPDDSHALGRGLASVAFALHPAILASVVQPTIDLPLLPCFLWGVVFVLRRKWVALVAVGLAMVFAKETGVILYAALVGSYGLLELFAVRRSARDMRRTIVRLVPLAIPLIAFAAYLAYRATIPQATVVWAAGTSEKSILKRFIVPRFDRPLASFLGMIFVLNFAWIASAIVAADTFVAVRRYVRRAGARALPGADAAVVRFLVVLAIVTVYALTRFTTYANTRYLLVAFALTPIVAYAATVRLGLSARARSLAIGALALGFAASTVFTVDPVSRGLYGTFAFGNRSLLRLTRITHECCGAGRDQLVYNLQFTNLADLTSEAMASIRATDSTAVFVPKDMSWGMLGALDSVDHRLTLRRNRAIAPHVLEPDSLLAMPAPAHAVFLALPMGDVPSALRALAEYYVVGPERGFAKGAYTLALYPLTLRGNVFQPDGVIPSASEESSSSR
jgi:hypothetical protein